jgi:hypothetical protein
MIHGMNQSTAPFLTVTPDDDLPRYPDPADDALASPMARRYSRTVADGQRAYSGNTETTRRREVVIHA